jgi:hypothetical protein
LTKPLNEEKLRQPAAKTGLHRREQLEDRAVHQHIRTLSAAAIGLTFALAFGPPVIAADLPQSGSFKLHSGWKGVGEVVPVEKDHVYGGGLFYGVTFNDAGSGPLHNGAGICNYALELMSGAGPVEGSCTWSDSDGDKIFTNYTGKLAASGAFSGMNQITGGTGKFRGIQGKVPEQCTALNDQSQYACTEQFEYSLTK